MINDMDPIPHLLTENTIHDVSGQDFRDFHALEYFRTDKKLG
jgi:hypothetical protein